MSAWVKARSRIFNIWHHDVAERMKIRRRGLARDAGFDESYDVGTYPEEPSTSIVIHEGMGFLRTALLAAVMGAAGLGGGIGLMSLLHQPAKETIEKIIEHEKVFDSDIEMEVIPPNPC